MKRDNTVTSMDTEVKAMEEQLTKLREENEIFNNHMHQDAHEFLNYLLNEAAEILEKRSKATAAAAGGGLKAASAGRGTGSGGATSGHAAGADSGESGEETEDDGSGAEDDGALLSICTDADGGTSLYVLDARDLRPLARARSPVGLPAGFHGEFFFDDAGAEGSTSGS